MEATHGSWGKRIITFRTEYSLTTILYLEPQQRCSWHVHAHTYNQFYCIKGKLGVKTDKGYTTELAEGQAFTVEPGVMHEFRTYESPTVVEEIAYVKFNENDIDRKNKGGPIKDSAELVEMIPKKILKGVESPPKGFD